MLIKFGIWEIDQDFGIIGKVSPTYDYNIPKERLWETVEYRSVLLWDWLFHLTEKTWMTSENFNDLVVAFTFAQDFFAESKPEGTIEASTAQSIFVAQQIVAIDEESKQESDDLGVNLGSPETKDDLTEYMEKMSQIKLLNN